MSVAAEYGSAHVSLSMIDSAALINNSALISTHSQDNLLPKTNPEAGDAVLVVLLL